MLLKIELSSGSKDPDPIYANADAKLESDCGNTQFNLSLRCVGSEYSNSAGEVTQWKKLFNWGLL